MKINIIITTTNSDNTAKQMAEYLVKKKFSPCVQIIPQIKSFYRWHDNIENINENLLIIKTTTELVNRCKKCILKLHNYDAPEIVVTNGEILNNIYKEWFITNIQDV